MRDIHYPGRSTVHGANGAAATSHPLATLAAIELLKAGGNAVDAAIGACAVLCVVEPMSTGIGGDCFALIAKNGRGPVIGINGSGCAPAKADAAWFADQGISEIGTETPHSVTVPGAIDAWDTLARDHGRLGLDRILQPAIRFAEEGFVVSPIVGLGWQFLSKRLQADEGAQQHLLIDGKAPKIGSKFKSPALGATLRAIAEKGRAAFYSGAIAEDMVSCLQNKGGLHEQSDFENQHGDYVTPISTAYKSQTVFEIPPNGQGITALIMLNILRQFPMEDYDPLSAERYHLQIEAQRLAFEARDTYVADPKFADVPVDHLLSDTFAAEQAARIRMDACIDDINRRKGPEYRDTVYLSVIDGDQTACSFINSLYFGFGSAIVAPQSGVLFQNRGVGFALDPSHPNCIAGGKRPLHTIIPGMALQDDNVRHSFGVMGGDFQPMGHVQVMLNMVTYGMDAQEALDAPRAFAGLEQVGIEKGLPDTVRSGLEARGHALTDALVPFGGGQVVSVDWEQGTLVAGSESRKDGCALAY